MAQHRTSKAPMRLLAGPKAYSQMMQHGLKPSHIEAMLAASGGPKCFILNHLDRYLSSSFLSNRETPLHLLGTSAGGWRFACYCMKDSSAALERFVQSYATTIYSDNANADEITDKAIAMIDDVLGTDGVPQILSHPQFHLHIIVARGRHLAQSESRLKQMAALLIAGASNAVSRKSLGLTFERILMHNTISKDNSPFLHLQDYPTRNYHLSEKNLRQTLLATGAIPLAVHPQQHLDGPGKGYYYDGGVTDYHFDLKVEAEGIVLYPHFYDHVTPGWFDKPLKWRKSQPSNYQNVLLAAPSPDFISSLPHGRISDRKDFETMTPEQRIPYWQQIIGEGERLAEFFAERAERQDWAQYVELMPEPPR